MPTIDYTYSLRSAIDASSRIPTAENLNDNDGSPTDPDLSGEEPDQFIPVTASAISATKSDVLTTFSNIEVTDSSFGSSQCLDIREHDLDGIRVTLRYGVQIRKRTCYQCKKTCDGEYIDACGGYNIERKQCLCLVNDLD